jgi:xylan 1,4-beta-xylosidase
MHERPAGPLELRVEVDRLRRVVSYSVDGGAWVPVGTREDTSFLSDQGTPLWPFTGMMVGVFAVDGGSGRADPADFDWFHHERQ